MWFKPPLSRGISMAVLALLSLMVVAEVMARRGGGRGHHGGRSGFTRVGPASGGSFTSRPARRAEMRAAPRPAAPPIRPSTMRATPRPAAPPMRPTQPRPLPANPPEERQERREQIRDKHQERLEDIRDDHWDHWRYRRQYVTVGTVYTTSDFRTDSCEATVVVDGVTYFQCDGVWYKRAYAGGTVTYVVVEGPRSD